MTDFDEEEPLASWEAALLPDWEWEAYDKKDDGTYFGRVKSPNTYGRWEYGYFTQEQLETAAAYRTDLDPDDSEPVFPDGGVPEDLAQIHETELDALLDEAYREEYDGGEGD